MRTSFLAALFPIGLASLAAAEDFSRYGLDLKTAPRPAACAPIATTLPLELRRGDHVCLIGNTLFERATQPTNRIEIHRWVEGEFGLNEEYVGDLLFSTNLSFIPVDLHFGPHGDLFIVDWYNPVKGHAQYSLRDSRRDRESGRIWRVTAKGQAVPPLPAIATASDDEIATLLGHCESRVRYLATRELAARDHAAAAKAIDRWLESLAADDPLRERKLVEGMWALSTVGAVRPELVAALAGSADHHVRSAAIRQLQFWHGSLPDRHELLARAAADPASLIPVLVKRMEKATAIKAPKPSKAEAVFDARKELATVEISCQPERMLFTQDAFTVRPGQPVKLVFTNPDATTTTS